MDFVRVRNLDPQLLSVNGEYMHVFKDKVAAGVAKGVWEIATDEPAMKMSHDAFTLAEDMDDKEMVAVPGMKYTTKDVLSYRDVHGEDKKA